MNRPGQSMYHRPSTLAPVVQWLLIANGAVFLLEMLAPAVLIRWLALWPLGVDEIVNAKAAAVFGYGSFQPWQLVTYGFLHAPANPAHIFFNMFALWMFGTQLERLWGSRPFAIYYFVCVIGAGLVQLAVISGDLSGGIAPTLGASGGVFGVLLAFGMMYPNQMILLIFPPIPMRAKYFVILYGIAELWLGVTAPHSTVAHFAHLGGMLFGFLMITYWRGQLPVRPRRILKR